MLFIICYKYVKTKLYNMKIVYNDIEKLLDMENDEIRSLYGSWDKGDCSIIGLIRILMIQEIKNVIKERGDYYDGQYDEVLKALYEKYNS